MLVTVADEETLATDEVIRDEFSKWFLDRMVFSEKSKIVRKIIDSIGLSDRLGGIPDQLERMNDERNAIAHSHVTFPLGDC